MLLLIDKPSGITSHDAITAVKKHLRQPQRDALSEEDKAQGIKPPKLKIGHAGTLDPLASGLLIAATDADTKQLHQLTGMDKIYETTIDFSLQTDTWDMDYWKEYIKYEVTKDESGYITGLILLNPPLLKEGSKDDSIPHRYTKEFIQSRNLLSTGYHLPYSKDAYEKAKQLRKNMTEAGKKLRKNYLQKSGYTVLRQKAIDHYIADFYIAQYKLVIEVDGEYHTSSDQKEYDQERESILSFYGLHVMRFTNKEVINSLGSVTKKIEAYMHKYDNGPSPLFSKEGLGVITSEQQHIPAPTTNQLTTHLDSILGTHDLPLTPFSAKKVDGKKLYEYARAGKSIFLTVPMTIHSYEIIAYEFPLLTLRLHVGSGTYIRSIAHRLGTQCNLGGILTMLRRTQIGDYSLERIHTTNKHIALWDEKNVYYTII